MLFVEDDDENEDDFSTSVFRLKEKLEASREVSAPV
jgi:hypothetical protein